MYQSSTVGYSTASSNNGFIGEYQAEVDDIFYNAKVNTIQKLRDSKLQDIKVNNNVGIKSEMPSSIFSMNTKIQSVADQDQIGLEDLLGFGRLSNAMHEEYEAMKQEIDAHNKSLPEYNSENSSNWIQTFIAKTLFDSKIDQEKINSCDEYIKKIISSSEFNYETDNEKKLSIASYFIPILGEYKMVAEIVSGRDLVSGRKFSIEEQLLAVGTLGTVSAIGKLVNPIEIVLLKLENIRKIGILFETSWDIDAGMAIRIENEKIIEVGIQNIAL